MIQFKSLLHTPYFLYVGNAYPHKNLERLLEAFNQLRIKSGALPVTKLVLVGKDDYFYNKVRKKVADMKLSGDVLFTGYVSDEELALLYQNAIATVIPSLAEGFGLPAIEAMQNSGIIAISDVAAHREICGGAPVYFDPMKTGDIIRAMRAIMLMDDSERKRRIQRGLVQAKKYSWKRMAEETVQIYHSALILQ